VPANLESLVARALQKEPRDRFESAKAMAEALEEDMGGEQSGHNRSEAVRRFGDFELGSALGQGATGKVYGGHQLSLGRDVIVKLITPERVAEREGRERFLRDARILCALSHPNLVGVLEVGEVDRQLYLSMERIDAGSLAERVGVPQPIEFAFQAIRDLSAALTYLHVSEGLHPVVISESSDPIDARAAGISSPRRRPGSGSDVVAASRRSRRSTGRRLGESPEYSLCSSSRINCGRHHSRCGIKR